MRKNIMETFQEEPGIAILPFVMRDLVELVMQKRHFLWKMRCIISILPDCTKHCWMRIPNFGIQVHYRFMIYWKKRNQNKRK